MSLLHFSGIWIAAVTVTFMFFFATSSILVSSGAILVDYLSFHYESYFPALPKTDCMTDSEFYLVC